MVSLIKVIIEEKVGKEIKKRIGKDVSERVISQMQEAAVKAEAKHGYGGLVGPTKSGSVNQGEHIFEMLGTNGKPVLRGHVNINPSRIQQLGIGILQRMVFNGIMAKFN